MKITAKKYSNPYLQQIPRNCHVIKAMPKLISIYVTDFWPLLSRITRTVFSVGVIKLKALDLHLYIEATFLILRLNLLHGLAQFEAKKIFQVI